MGSPSRSRLVIAGAALAGLLLVALVGLVATSALVGSPVLQYRDQPAMIAGGEAIVSGTATNSGKSDAANVVVKMHAQLGSGLDGQATIPKVAAGATQPYAITIPLGSATQPGNFSYDIAVGWDDPSLDVAGDGYDHSIVNGHGIVTHHGSVHNAGKGEAPNTVITFKLTGDQGGSQVLAQGTQNLGSVPAGGDKAYSIDLDLGASPPDSWYSRYSFAWDEAKVAAETDTAKFVGGTATLTGSVLNGGRAPAKGVTVTRQLLNLKGIVLANGSARLGQVAGHGKAPYAITIDLGQTSIQDVHTDRIVIAWTEMQLLVVPTSRSSKGPA